MPNCKLTVISRVKNSKADSMIRSTMGKKPINHVKGMDIQLHVFSYHTKREALKMESKVTSRKGLKVTTDIRWDS